MKKGDRIETADPFDGKIVFGIVEAVRAGKIIMAVDAHPATWKSGSITTISGGEKAFRASDVPNPNDVVKDEMSEYFLTKYKHFRGHDGQGYTATVTRNGKPTLELFDDGWGGMLEVSVLKGVADDEKNLFLERVRAWHVQYGDNGEYADGGVWVDWSINDRKYGVTSAMYWKNTLEEWAGYKKEV